MGGFCNVCKIWGGSLKFIKPENFILYDIRVLTKRPRINIFIYKKRVFRFLRKIEN